MTGSKLASANSEYAFWVPDGNKQVSSSTYADWGDSNETAELSIPSWATKARVAAFVSGVYNVTDASDYSIRLVIGSDTGSREVRTGSTSTTGSEKLNPAWVDEITLTSTGTQTMKLQGKKDNGSGALRAATDSLFTFIITYIP